jgi:aryl sulfotransferase
MARRCQAWTTQQVTASSPETTEPTEQLVSVIRISIQPRTAAPAGLRYAHRVTAAPTRYQPPGEDNGRWPDFRFRADDIVISTPRKSGTTWMQMICALLIFQTPELPAPLWQLSPWLDTPDVPPEHVYAQLAAQRHRRFIKTHTPLAGIPSDAGVTYIVIGRHPADAFVSMYHQDRLIGPSAPPPPSLFAPPDHSGLLGRPGPPWFPGSPPPPHGPPPMPHGLIPHPPHPAPPAPNVSREELHDALIDWIGDDDGSPRHSASLPSIMEHLSEAWTRRADPNVVLVHYDDLRSDLERQMRRLADRLGIAVAERSWATLVEAATFERMRDRDDVLVPPPPGIAANNALFFRRGASGAAREILSDEEMAWYDERVARLASPEMIEWLHPPVPRRRL